MLSLEVEIINNAGLHTRPAAAIVKIASKYKSDFFLIRDDMEVNGKSIIGVMTMAAEKGSKIILQLDGPDEEEAAQELKELFENGFGEL